MRLAEARWFRGMYVVRIRRGRKSTDAICSVGFLLAAAEALRAAGYRAMVTPVLAVRVPNVKGGLATLLEFLDQQSVNIEYGYCFSVNPEMAIDVLKIGEAEGIEAKLEEAGFATVSPEEVYQLDC